MSIYRDSHPSRDLQDSIDKDIAARMERKQKLEGERPDGCTKGCTGRMCRDALNCDAKGRQ